jgi:hypothetical protein
MSTHISGEVETVFAALRDAFVQASDLAAAERKLGRCPELVATRDQVKDVVGGLLRLAGGVEHELVIVARLP